jgi:hypothetical protein
MAFIYSILILLALSLVAYGLVWLYFKYPETKKEALTGLDKDLLKTNKTADVHGVRGVILAIAFCVVSIYTYNLLSYEEVTIHEIKEKSKAPVAHEASNEIDDIHMEIPDEQPEKKEIVFTPKPVSNNTVIKNDPIKGEEDDDFDEDDDLKADKPKEEEVKPSANKIIENPTVLPQYVNGGEVGLDNKMVMMLQNDMSRFDPGFYAVPLEFVIEINGSVSGVKLVPGEEIESKEIANLVIKAFIKMGAAGAFTPGNNDGQLVRVRMQKPFFVEIQ